MPSTEPFLSDFRESRNKFVKFPIQHQLLVRSQLTFIIPIVFRITSA